ncbi:16S rRNA (cytidine(1402)-2'-O)-methyltransferase [Granulicella cerasi]|uniref:Ribosomal RNA small subunit methyltransferase I n=1 Tax=Granulicella cerasi TaxID=741063 RepID=A0ABW1Z6E9_9BACT|nr:16S rRNA (cytidine(1402)-2'-O)-methyltransferase [Granulicella cerasi]
MQLEPKPIAPGLYLVATPIGNLDDMTLRALNVLTNADRIACEDTRQTAKLLSHFGISTPTVSYHDHNELSRSTQLLEQLKQGARIAVVSDAGTPGIADPGAVLAADAIAAGIAVFPIPGANAAINALIASGLSAEAFAFHGFLAAKEGARRTQLEELRTQLAASKSGATQIFYETPHRILGALEDVRLVFGPTHRIALARELTKLHEEFLRGTVAELEATLSARENIRGEMVLMISGTVQEEAAVTGSLAKEVAALIASGVTEKDALKQVAKARGLGKSEAYREWQRVKR